MNTAQQNDSYWRKKLSAYMHDNAAKALDIKDHELRAYMQRQVDALENHEQFDRESDFKAAAADRLPFPNAKAMLANPSKFQLCFKHPLTDRKGTDFPITGLTADLVDEIAQGNRTYLEEADARGHFIARWRFWRAWCSERNEHIAFLPADTRIPDHSIWNHNSLTSAFQGCLDNDKPALLLFSIGPVQSFIAAARNIRDLWSGSYLLSYLMSHALGHIAKTYGPDHIIFPSVWAQPLVDLQMKEVYQQCKVRSDFGDTLWDQLWQNENPNSRQQYLLPSLPNRFLAMVPASKAEEVARELTTLLRNQLKSIGDKVFTELAVKAGDNMETIASERFYQQLDEFLEVHWHALAFPDNLDDVEALAKKLLPESDSPDSDSALKIIKKLKAAFETIPKEHRPKYTLSKETVGWQAMTAINSWALDAVKQTRRFDAWNKKSSWEYGKDQNKDSLTGKEEAILVAPASDDEATALSKRIAQNPNLLRAGERLGAMTLIKRFWHLFYLQPTYGFEFDDFAMPNLRNLCKGKPFSKDGDETESGEEDSRDYYAVLALDGDEMGKWISGAKTPLVESRLSPPALEYFERNIDFEEAGFLKMRRPLNPSFHLQFSEALANFGRYAVRWIVESFDGRLIYAGGDDVLAILPAQNALVCAKALRAAFQGDFDGLSNLKGVWRNGIGRAEGTKVHNPEVRIFDQTPLGYLRLHRDLLTADSGERLCSENDPVDWVALVPGPDADVSVGIAIGHAKSPLQDLVKAAQAAEKHAKNALNRGAVSMTIVKRSGEQVQWGGKWNQSAGLDLLQLLLNLSEQNNLSKRFPYKMIERLQVYLPAPMQDGDQAVDTVFAENLQAILNKELTDVLQHEQRRSDGHTEIKNLFSDYWSTLEIHQPTSHPAIAKLHNFIGLLQTLAWMQKGLETE